MEISAIRQFFDNVRVFWLITSMVDLCNPLPRYLKVCAARYWGIGVLMLGGGTTEWLQGFSDGARRRLDLWVLFHSFPGCKLSFGGRFERCCLGC